VAGGQLQRGQTGVTRQFAINLFTE